MVFLHNHNFLTIIAQYHSRSWLLGFGTGHVLSGCLKRKPDAGLDALAPGLLQMKSLCQGWPFATMRFEILCYHATLQHGAQVEVAPGVKARRLPGRLLKQGIAVFFTKSWVLLFPKALVGHDDLCGKDVGDVTIPCPATIVSTMNW